jgi:hypothetical protein
MTVDQARTIALSLPEAFESSHHGHPDFRIKKGIFATLWPDKETSVLRLPLELAEAEAQEHPDRFKIVGHSGGMGWLACSLPQVSAEQYRVLAEIAWERRK